MALFRRYRQHRGSGWRPNLNDPNTCWLLSLLTLCCGCFLGEALCDERCCCCLIPCALPRFRRWWNDKNWTCFCSGRFISWILTLAGKGLVAFPKNDPFYLGRKEGTLFLIRFFGIFFFGYAPGKNIRFWVDLPSQPWAVTTATAEEFFMQILLSYANFYL